MRDLLKLLSTLACVTLGGCLGDERQLQLPTSATPAVQAPAAVYANPSGDYQITFTASASCEQLPSPVRSRSYQGTIDGGGRMFEARLTNPSFYDHYNTFWLYTNPGRVNVSIYSLFASRQWLDEEPIFERLDSGGYVALRGTSHVQLDAHDASATGTWEGSFAYCARPGQRADPIYPPTCSNIVSCASDSHLISFERR